MADVFISYSSSDRDTAQKLAQALEELGFSVWWDRKILPGKRFSQTIEAALQDSACVVVLWSSNSVDSDWVHIEAAEAARRNILIPVFIEEIRLPLEFSRWEAAELQDWEPGSPHIEFDQFIDSVRAFADKANSEADQTRETEPAINSQSTSSVKGLENGTYLNTTATPGSNKVFLYSVKLKKILFPERFQSWLNRRDSIARKSHFGVLDLALIVPLLVIVAIYVDYLNTEENSYYSLRYNTDSGIQKYYTLSESDITLANFPDGVTGVTIHNKELLTERIRDVLYTLSATPFPDLELLRQSVRNRVSTLEPEQSDLMTWTADAVEGLLDTILAQATEQPAVDTYPRESKIDYRFQWQFPGCGCDIYYDDVIYGFYPSWLLTPDMLQGEQVIDLAYYDRIAYYGLSLGEDGSISDDDLWSQGGVFSDFILGAHKQAVLVDLVVHSSSWERWSDSIIERAASNIIDRLTIPLDAPFAERLVTSLAPVGPSTRETIGRSSMGDGLTLFFENVSAASNSDQLYRLIDLVNYLSGEIEETLSGDLPINLMLDLEIENARQVFSVLEPLITGQDGDIPIDRIFIFLEQDTEVNRERLRTEVVAAYSGAEGIEVLRRIHPILVPEKDIGPGANEYTNLIEQFEVLPETFGTLGGVALWPLAIQSSFNDQNVNHQLNIEIDRQLRPHRQNQDTGQSVRQSVREYYFPYRLFIIFTTTFIFLEYLLTLALAKLNLVPQFTFNLFRVLGGLSATCMLAMIVFVDPYISSARVLFFSVALLVLGYLKWMQVKKSVQ